MQNPLANTPSPTDITEDKPSRFVSLKRWIGRHPYLSALLFLVYWLVLLLALGRLFSFVLTTTHLSQHLSFLQVNLLGEVLLVLIVALPIFLLGWWSRVGLTRGINGQGVVICLIPLLLLVGIPLLGVLGFIGQASESILVTAIALSLLTGFAEEGMFRGLIVRALLPAGIWPAVLVSALCFTAIHLTNLINGLSLGYVAGQLILAFGSGVLFAAIRLRTNSLWPSLLLHAGHDVGGLILLGIDPAIALTPLTSAAIIVNGVFCLLFLLNAWVLLRASQVRRLKVAYGLAPAPVPGNPYNPYMPYPPSTPYPPSPPYPPSTPYQEYTSHPLYGNQPPPPAPPSMPHDGA